jgi:hypothetical protein
MPERATLSPKSVFTRIVGLTTAGEGNFPFGGGGAFVLIHFTWLLYNNAEPKFNARKKMLGKIEV